MIYINIIIITPPSNANKKSSYIIYTLINSLSYTRVSEYTHFRYYLWRKEVYNIRLYVYLINITPFKMFCGTIYFVGAYRRNIPGFRFSFKHTSIYSIIYLQKICEYINWDFWTTSQIQFGVVGRCPNRP